MRFDVVVEVGEGCSVKYEINKDTGEIRVDRFLHTSFVYPFNYGFIKNTRGKDNDPLDTIVVSTHTVEAGAVIKCHAVGMLQMKDEEGVDTKIIAVPIKKIDPEYGKIEDLKDVPEATLKKIKHFFSHMKELEPNKWVKTGGYKGRTDAEKVITECLLAPTSDKS